MSGKVHVLSDENLGGVLREFVEVDRKAEVGDKKLLPDGTILTAVEPYDRGDGKTPGMWFQDTSGERYPYYNDDNNRLIEPTDIVHINGARYRLVDRKAKVGEEVIVVNTYINDESYKNGDIFGVCQVRPSGILSNVDEDYITLFHSEYRVLEPAQELITATADDQKSIIDLLANLAERLTKLERKVDRLEQAITTVARNVETWAEEIERLKHEQNQSVAQITMDAATLAKLIAEVKA